MKIPRSAIPDIYHLRNLGYSLQKIADEYGVSHQCIHKIIHTYLRLTPDKRQQWIQKTRSRNPKTIRQNRWRNKKKQQ